MNADWKDRLASLGETSLTYAQKIPSWLLGLIVVFLVLFLVGCASSPIQPTTVKVVEKVYIPVPATLLQRQDLPRIEGETNESLYKLTLEYRRQLLQCYKDKELIEQLVVPSR